MKTTKKINTPFTSPTHHMIVAVTEGASVTVQISADGVTYEDLGTAVTGPEIIQVNDIVPGTWFKLAGTATGTSAQDIPVIF